MVSSRLEADPESTGAAIIYDGQCPFCSAYVRLSRLRETVQPVALIDARSGGPEVDEVRRAGLNIDQGMVLKFGGRLYHGADCLNMIALLSSRSSLFSRVTSTLFRRPRLAGAAYPVLRALRNAALLALGRDRISAG